MGVTLMSGYGGNQGYNPMGMVLAVLKTGSWENLESLAGVVGSGGRMGFLLITRSEVQSPAAPL